MAINMLAPWPAPTPARGPHGIQGFVWAVWPWMNWLLPAFLVLHGFLAGNGGWETLMLLFASPVLVPVTGLLAALPRFILRKRGHETAPGPIIWLLFVNWWSWITFTITMRGSTDSSPLPSILSAIITVPLSTPYEQTLLLASVGLAVLAWTAILIIVLVLPVPATRRRTWTLTSWIAAFAVPMLLIGIVWAGVVATAQQRDAAGDTVAEIQATDVSVQMQRAEARYALTQQRLSAVREVIAEDGWRVISSSGGWAWQNGFSYSDDYDCQLAAADCYGVDARFTLEGVPAGIDRAYLVDAVRPLGWKLPLTGRLEATDVDGFTLKIEELDPDTLSVEIESPSWWGDPYELGQALGEGGRGPDEEDLDRTYRYDEWPQLS